MQWQYKTVTVTSGPINSENTMDVLNVYGEEGWEVFATHPGKSGQCLYWMKREVPEETLSSKNDIPVRGYIRHPWQLTAEERFDYGRPVHNMDPNHKVYTQTSVEELLQKRLRELGYE